MTQPTDKPETHQTPTMPQKRVKFYRHRRIVHPLLISLVAFAVEPNPFVMFMAYVVSGLLWDWVVFSYDGCKDSELLPEPAFEAIGITGQQLDDLNSFQVDVRRGAFAASVAASASTYMFLTISWEVTLMFAYVIVTISSMIIATKIGKIISLYRFSSNEGQEYQFSYPWSIIFGPHYNAGSTSTINNTFA
jgi:hypothetical protein